jgi:UDP-N-acetylmuramate dehydrogenase
MSTRAYAALQDRVQARLGSDGGLAHLPRFDVPDGRVKTSSAWLIDKAGFGKGYGMPGPAALSTKHPLAVTNRGSATAAEVVSLAREVRDGVRDVFGVTLVSEPVLVGASL